MHVLTKIFIVLVSLLAVLLVPLVVVYAHNEDSYKSKFESESLQAAAANQSLTEARMANANREAELELQIRELIAETQSLAKEREGATADIQRLEIDLAASRSQQAAIRADLATISSAVAAGQDVNASLLGEARTMRSDALSAERRVVGLDEALRDITGQLDSAIAARRAMQEELQHLKQEHAHAMEQMGAYREKYGRLDLQLSPLSRPNVDLDATVTSVRRDRERTLAEINAGSRDGVREGWVMSIGRSGSFLGNLRIITVDINRATGVVELEDPNGRGQVEAGDRVYARRGRG